MGVSPLGLLRTEFFMRLFDTPQTGREWTHTRVDTPDRFPTRYFPVPLS